MKAEEWVELHYGDGMPATCLCRKALIESVELLQRFSQFIEEFPIVSGKLVVLGHDAYEFLKGLDDDGA
jgi:hypothetical protein